MVDSIFETTENKLERDTDSPQKKFESLFSFIFHREEAGGLRGGGLRYYYYAFQLNSLFERPVECRIMEDAARLLFLKSLLS